MCAVSMVGDHYQDKWKDRNFGIGWPQSLPAVPTISRAEFDALKRDVEEMKLLLKRAKDYDERNNEPHCEMDEKVALLKKVAELVGVDLSEVFGASK
jgi:hypothetical protein